jgi:hypothetical protein
MSLPFTAPAPAVPLPVKPFTANAAIWVAGVAALLMLVAPFFIGPFSLLVVPLVLVYGLLIGHIARGSNAARIGYLVFDFLLLLPSLLVGKYPVDMAGPAPLLDAVFFVLTLFIWGALLYPSTNRWFRDVKEARLAAPLSEQMAATRLELKLALAWGLAALAAARLLAKTASMSGAGLVWVALPFLLVGTSIAVVQVLRLRRLQEQARSPL